MGCGIVPHAGHQAVISSRMQKMLESGWSGLLISWIMNLRIKSIIIEQPPIHFHREPLCFTKAGLIFGDRLFTIEYKSKSFSRYARSINDDKPGRIAFRTW